MVREKTISITDPQLLLITDSIDEAVNYIKEKSVKEFGLRLKPNRILGERVN